MTLERGDGSFEMTDEPKRLVEAEVTQDSSLTPGAEITAEEYPIQSGPGW
jgi:hypothetical protein